ncbi:hypothetical protein CKO44_10430, partial [Rubrivivax gelatinosus]|nr:hypothetical protein [Rubrivivax gelatinosus]
MGLQGPPQRRGQRAHRLRVRWRLLRRTGGPAGELPAHQADNHRGSFRGLGFELRTDAWGAIRAAQGILLTTYGQPEAAPAGDNAAGLALVKQLATLIK